MTEAELQVQIIAAARDLGYKAVHWRAAMSSHGRWQVAVQGDGVGYPDLTLCKPGRLIVAELKQDGKHPTSAQQAWLDVLATVPGCESYVWTPKDWLDGSIVRVLLAVRVEVTV